MAAVERVVRDDRYETVTLVEPTTSGYIHLAAEIDRGPVFLWSSARKRRALRQAKARCAELAQRDDVVAATVFRGLVIPPGRGAYLAQRPHVHVARFDVAVLIETVSPDDIPAVLADERYLALEEAIRTPARHVHKVTAYNARNMGQVDHNRQGVFLFNYFTADEAEQNLAVWEYTAGWFERETRLDNSTLLRPLQEEASDYTVVNHCRWDSLVDIVPSLLFKPTFRSYVLHSFEANRTAAIPILYRLA